MASQLARGFLAEQDLERFVREEHGGNRAAAARAKAASGEACMRNAPKAALKYFRDALDLATTEAARAAVHRSCAAACLEIGHFNRCAGHATRALVTDHDDKVALKHRLAAHEAIGAWRRMNADALRLSDEKAAARAAAKGGDQPVELHAPSESHKTVQAALDEAYLCVEINQCVGCTRQFFTKSFLGDDAAVLARSSGEETTSLRHRAGAASMAWRTTRRFSTNAP
jgi:hypothetical protein